jgi:hypothetical protein
MTALSQEWPHYSTPIYLKALTYQCGIHTHVMLDCPIDGEEISFNQPLYFIRPVYLGHI